MAERRVIRLRRRHRRRHGGATMVEFALLLLPLLVIVFGVVDFGRYIQINSTVADAARQGARQAIPAAASADNPFGAPGANPRCSGQVFTYNVTSTGCLTDAAVFATVKGVLQQGNIGTTVTLRPNRNAQDCMTLPSPAAGAANVCIAPAESAYPTYQTSCPAGSGEGTPAPTALARKDEWTQRTFQDCKGYYVTVTVVYTYQAWTPLINRIVGTKTIVSSTQMLAEY